MRVMPETLEEKAQAASDDAVERRETTCCIVGGGPAGVVLALLLARAEIPVILLEAHEDFDRDFRGDTIHPSVVEILDELGLVDHLLELRPSKIQTFTSMMPDVPVAIADLRHLKTKF